MIMQETNINDVLQSISTLSLDDQSFISETLNKRVIELRRNQIASRAKEAEANYQAGNVTQGNVSDLMKVLDND